VRLLLEKGAIVDRKSGAGTTALYTAIVNDYGSVVDLLLDYGADITMIPLLRR